MKNFQGLKQVSEIILCNFGEWFLTTQLIEIAINKKSRQNELTKGEEQLQFKADNLRSTERKQFICTIFRYSVMHSDTSQLASNS